MNQHPHERELPMLAGIASALRWVEELANIVAGPLLTAGLAIALVDLLTDGKLLASQPELVYAWAVSQSVGVDMQLVGAWDKARLALRTHRYWSLLGLLVLGAALAYVGYLAAIVFAMQQSAGISTAEALSRLGMDNATWLISRAALSVVLVCLSGWTRYHPPAKAAPSLADERAAIERELTLEPLRAELRARKAVGWRGVASAIAQGTPAGASLALPTPTPEAASVSQNDGPVDETGSVIPSLPAPVQPQEPVLNITKPITDIKPPTEPTPPPSKPRVRTRRGAKRKKQPRGALLRLNPEPAERRIRAVLEADPGASIKTIASRAHVGTSTASKWRGIILAEQANQRKAAAQ